jgi:hypothetical protein
METDHFRAVPLAVDLLIAERKRVPEEVLLRTAALDNLRAARDATEDVRKRQNLEAVIAERTRSRSSSTRRHASAHSSLVMCVI